MRDLRLRQLKPFVDIEFRNAMAHGLVGTAGNEIVLYKKNAIYEVLDKLDLTRFMIHSKDQNVLTQCLINVIVAKKNSGFFL